jgi:hypothetical protein
MGGLVSLVSCAIHPSRYPDPNIYEHEARIALRAVVLWLRNQNEDWSSCADAIEQEVRR